MSTDELPPWGVMEDIMEELIRKRPIPEAWRWPNGSKAKMSDWTAWRDSLVNELAALLWPTYDAVRGKWTTPPDQALIDADFTLLHTLRDNLGMPVNGLGQSAAKHIDFFNDEDDEKIIFGSQYERYDPGLPQYLRTNLTDILWNGCNRKLGSLHFQLKKAFQRPRPFQVAAIQRRDYSYVWAKTGGTPSLVSGHCLQGSMAGCSAFALFGGTVDVASVDVLKQFTVDIGDRRVFAGVHYPSDNLSSWFTALKLIPHVFEESTVSPVTAFLWDAISSKSAVYAAIAAQIDFVSDSPYKPAVEALKRIASSSMITIDDVEQRCGTTDTDAPRPPAETRSHI